MEFHVYHHHIDGSCSKPDDKILDELKRIETTLLAKFQRIEQIMSQMDDELAVLKTKVESLKTVADSAVTLIQGFPALITSAVNTALAAGATPEQLQAVTDLGTAIDADAAELAASVTANTPAAPTP